MNAIDSSNLTNVNQPQVDTTGFVPAGTFSYDDGDQEITIDCSTSTYAEAFKAGNVTIHDLEGGTVRAALANDETKVIDVSSLDQKSMNISVTLVDTNGSLSDGSAWGVNVANASGALGNWTSKQFSTAQVVA